MHIHVYLHLVERAEGSNFLPSWFLRRDLLLAFPFKIAFQNSSQYLPFGNTDLH